MARSWEDHMISFLHNECRYRISSFCRSGFSTTINVRARRCVVRSSIDMVIFLFYVLVSFWDLLIFCWNSYHFFVGSFGLFCWISWLFFCQISWLFFCRISWFFFSGSCGFLFVSSLFFFLVGSRGHFFVGVVAIFVGSLCFFLEISWFHFCWILWFFCWMS